MVLCKVIKTPVVFYNKSCFYRGELRKKKKENGKEKRRMSSEQQKNNQGGG